MNYPDIKEIVRLWLTDNGYDGLYDYDGECGCDLTDVMPCYTVNIYCKAGYKAPCDCEEGCDFHIIFKAGNCLL